MDVYKTAFQAEEVSVKVLRQGYVESVKEQEEGHGSQGHELFIMGNEVEEEAKVRPCKDL